MTQFDATIMKSQGARLDWMNALSIYSITTDNNAMVMRMRTRQHKSTSVPGD